MGTICIAQNNKNVMTRTESEKDKEVIKISDINNKQLRFEVNTHKLIHLSADLLVLFMDHTTNLKRNDHFLKLPLQGAKLEQHAIANLERQRLTNPQGSADTKFITFNIIIPTLNFGKVSILFCDTWREQVQNQVGFRQTLHSYFQSISKENFKNIVIAEFTSELGIHVQKGAKCIVKQLARMEQKPEVIQFCCLSDESREVFAETVSSRREQLSRSISTHNSRLESDYF